MSVLRCAPGPRSSGGLRRLLSRGLEGLLPVANGGPSGLLELRRVHFFAFNDGFHYWELRGSGGAPQLAWSRAAVASAGEAASLGL